jgi:predicted dienelactone hydrolase
MKHRIVAKILPAFLAAFSVAVWSPSIAHSREGGTVGYRTTVLPGAEREAVPCSVWYPGVGGTTRAVYDFGRATRTADAYIDAKPDTGGGPYPLIIYSHGYSGCSIASAYLCEALAAAGFVVAAPDHSDDLKVCSLSPGFQRKPFVALKILFSAVKLGDRLAQGKYDLTEFRYRFNQIEAAIDRLAAEDRDPRSPLFNLIDSTHIGAVGHSLGAFSVTVAAGAGDVGIELPIDAVVAMSGPGGDAFTCAQMGRIKIPAMLMYGTEEADRQRKGEGILAQYRCLAGPKFLMALVGGDHLSFSEGIFSDSSPGGRLKHEADVRHDLISRYVVAFFTLYLTGDDRAVGVLREKDPGLAPYFFSF